MKASLMASASSFAHLLGRGPKAAKAGYEEKDEKEPKSAKEDEEKGDGDDEGDGPNDGKGKKAAKAEDTDRDEKDDEDDERDDEEKDDAKKGKKAKGKRAEGDDGEGDDGDDGADMRKKGAKQMQDRCAKIFASEHATKNLAQTAQLAFCTDLSASQAISILSMAASPVSTQAKRPSLDERMAAVKTPAIGAGDAAAPTGAQGLAAQIVAAGLKARGKA